MKKILFYSLLLVSIDIFSIDIKLDRFLPNPSMDKYNFELKGISKNKKRLSFSSMAWLNKTELLLYYAPFFFIYDTTNDSLTRYKGIEDIIGYEHPINLLYANSNYIRIQSGYFLEPDYFIYSKDKGLKELNKVEEYKEIPSDFTLDYNQVEHFGDYTSWGFKLLGGHLIVPGHQYVEEYNHTYEYDVKLKKENEEQLVSLLADYHLVKILGGSSYITISFDRFRLVIFSHSAYKRKEDYVGNSNSKNGYFLLSIEYEGRVISNSRLWSKPTEESEIIREVTTDESFIVVEADNYYENNTSEDFWYYVKTEGQSGWIKGENLLIEGYGWEDRLITRGKPIYWDDITDDGYYTPKESLVEEIEADESKIDVTNEIAPVSTVSEVQADINDKTAKPKNKMSKELLNKIILGLTLLLVMIIVGVIKKNIKK